MTEANTTPLPGATPPLSAAEQARQALSEWFSPETLEFIEPETARYLWDLREGLRQRLGSTIDFVEEVETPAFDSKIEAIFEAHPHAAAWAQSCQELTPRGTDRLHKISEVYRSYLQFKPYFQLTTREIEAEVAAVEAHQEESEAILSRAKPLVAQYYEAGDNAERARLCAEIRSELRNIRVPISGQHVADYFVAAGVVSKLASLDIELGIAGGDKVIERFVSEPLGYTKSVTPHEETATPYLSFGELLPLYDRFIRLGEGNRVFGRLRNLLLLHHDMMQDEQSSWAEELLEAGMDLLDQVYDKIETAETPEIVDMVARCNIIFDSDSVVRAAQREAIKRLSLGSHMAARLATARAEVGDFLRPLLDWNQKQTGEENGFLYPQWQELSEVYETDWSDQVVAARGVVQVAIAGRLSGLVDQAAPLTRLTTGQKPRGKSQKQKQAGASAGPDPTQIAQEAYDALHKNRIFTPEEAALIAAIAAGKWDELQLLRRGIIDTQAQLVSLAETLGYTLSADQIAVLNDATVDLYPVLKAIQDKVGPRWRERPLAALGNREDLVRDVVRHMTQGQ